MNTGAGYNEEPNRVVFYVGDRVYCLLGFDIDFVLDDFVSHIDPEFFASTAVALARRIERRKLSQGSAMILRMSYLHALETALALTFASVQAPSAVPAWLRLYRAEDLDALCSRVLSGGSIEGGWVRQPAGCAEIVARLMSRMPDPLTASSGRIVSREECLNGFSKTLGHMMRDFLDAPTRQEYNDVKHGFRATVGGFRLAFVEEGNAEGAEGRRPATFLADSGFGSSSWSLDTVSGVKHLVRYVHNSRNWDPRSIAQRMQVVAAWIANVKAGLTVAHGGAGPATKWEWFADPDAYERPWLPTQPTRSMSWRVGDFHVSNPPSREDLVAAHRRAREAAARRGE